MLHQQFVSKGGKLTFTALQLVESGPDGRPQPAGRPLTAERLREVIRSLGGGYLPTPPKAEGGAGFARKHVWSWVELGPRLAHGVLEAGGWLAWGRRDWRKEVEAALFEEADLERHLALGKPESEWEAREPSDDDPLWRDLLARALPTSQDVVLAYRPETGELVLPSRGASAMQDDIARLLQLCWGLESAPALHLRELGRGTLPEGEPLETLRRLAKAGGHLVQRALPGGPIVGAWRVVSAADKVKLSDPEGDLGSLVATGEVASAILRVAQEGPAAESQLEELVTQLAVPGLTVRLSDLVSGRAWGLTLKPNGDVSALVRLGHAQAEADLRKSLKEDQGGEEDDEDGDQNEEKPVTPATRTAAALRSLEEQAWLLALALSACRDGRRLHRALVAAVRVDKAAAFEGPVPVQSGEVEGLGECALQWEGVPDVPQPLDGRQALIPFGLGGAVSAPTLAAPLLRQGDDSGDTFEQTQAFGRGVQAARAGAACAAPEHLDGELARAWTQGWREESDRLREASASRAAARAQARGGRTAEEQAARRLSIVEGLLRARHDQDGEGSWADVGDLVEDSAGFSREQVTEALARLVALGRAERSPVGAYRPVLGGPAGQVQAPPAAPAPVAAQAPEPAAAPRPVRAALPSQEPSGEADEAPAPTRKRRSSAEVLEQRTRSQAKAAAQAAGAAAYAAGVLYDSAPAGMTGPELLSWRAGWAGAKRAAQGAAPVADHAEDLAALPAHRRLGRAQLEGSAP